MPNIKKLFKGGSLSRTELIECDGELFVRKSCSLLHDREYGLSRLFSQKTRMSMLQQHHPDLFPKVLRVGSFSDEAFVDYEYLGSHVPLVDFLTQKSHSSAVVERLFTNIMDAFCRVHDVNSGTIVGRDALELYFNEELLGKCDALVDRFDCLKGQKFLFNGKEVFKPNAHVIKGWISNLCINKLELTETLGHGNLTLENMLVNPESLELALIDCYEENFFGSKYNDFSQILQCSQYHYSLLVNEKAEISAKGCVFESAEQASLKKLQKHIVGWRESLFNSDERLLVDLFLVSQFTRMLPFKIAANNLNHALGFYAISCEIYTGMLEKYN